MTTPESPRKTASERERPNDSLPLRAANFLGDTTPWTPSPAATTTDRAPTYAPWTPTTCARGW